MDFSKALTVVLCCTILFYGGVSGLCKINLTSFTADCSLQGLQKVPSYIPGSMEIIDMSGNRFQEINPRQFKRFQNLQELKLEGNNISHLSNDSDTGLSTLRVLDLSFNKLQDFNFVFFAGIPNLQKLTIWYNDLEIPLFKGLRNLTYLDMSDNRPISINSTPFMELKHLEDLCLRGCRLQYLNKNMFTGLSKLMWLDLAWNKLEYLPSDLFVRLANLKVVNLEFNPLYHSTSFPTEIFQPLIHLEKLQLNIRDSFTKFLPANYTYLSDQIKHVPTLKELYIPGAPNAKFGLGFTALKNLKCVWISGSLSEINNETFANLRYARNLTLSLFGTKFDSILPNTFTALNNLIALGVMSNNALCNLNIWSNLTAAICNSRVKVLKATNLDCPDHRMEYWPCRKAELEFLDMSYGNIWVIMTLPDSLIELRVKNNLMVPVVNNGFLDGLHKLRILDLSDQLSRGPVSNTNLQKDIRRASAGLSDQHWLHKRRSPRLDNFTTLVYTDFNKSGQYVELKAKFMVLKNQAFNPEIRSLFTIPALLEWIDVSKSALMCELYHYDNTNNSIKTLKTSSLRPYAMCTANYIFSRIWAWLTNLTMLENLDLSGNHIKIIPVGAFTTTTNLKHVDLSQNSLLILKFEIKCLVNLNEIILSNNVIRYASSQFMAEIKQDLTIYLDGNNLSCDCTQSNFVHWLSTTNVIYNITGLMCTYENGSQVSLNHRAYIYQQIEYGCNYILVTFSCVAIFAFFLIVGGAVAVVSHKRWKAQYLSAFGRQTVNPYHPLEECNIELEYDIYISYERDHDITSNETLHSLVANKLYPWFQQKGMKVLIREELDIGRKLYEVISNAMRKSRKVIVLLSNDYCIDYWNVFEFNVAAMEGIYTKRRVLIPVAFEILKPEAFHEEIATFIKSVPIPRYTMGTDFIELAEYLFGKVRMAD